MKKSIILISLLTTLIKFSIAQNVGIGTISPNSTSILELNSTTKGVLIPRMTQLQRNAIILPAQGLLIYQTDLDSAFYYYKGITWQSLSRQGGISILPQLNKIIYSTLGLNQSTGGSNGIVEIWIANSDGTNKAKINISMPAGNSIEFGDTKLSPDGQRIFFRGRPNNATGNNDDFYSCKIDGSNVIKIIDGSIYDHVEIGGAY